MCSRARNASRRAFIWIPLLGSAVPIGFHACKIVARAVWSERMLKLHYRRAGEAEARPRKVAPLGLVLKGGIWYLHSSAREIHSHLSRRQYS